LTKTGFHVLYRRSLLLSEFELCLQLFPISFSIFPCCLFQCLKFTLPNSKSWLIFTPYVSGKRPAFSVFQMLRGLCLLMVCLAAESGARPQLSDGYGVPAAPVLSSGGGK
jgi:hypothetical protein